MPACLQLAERQQQAVQRLQHAHQQAVAQRAVLLRVMAQVGPAGCRWPLCPSQGPALVLHESAWLSVGCLPTAGPGCILPQVQVELLAKQT
jgi:hypothetical protein